MKGNKFLKKVQIGLLLMGVVLASGCGANKSSKSEGYAIAEDRAQVESTAESNEEKSDTAEAPQTDNQAPQVSTEVGYNRKIIKTGELQLQTKVFKESVEKLTAKVQSLGGYIESSDIQGSNFYSDYVNMRNASLVVRLPQKSFDSFMNDSSAFGNVVSTSSNSEDITSRYVDTEIRLKSLTIRHERLLALLEQSGSLKDLFEIEQELGEVTYEIEKLTGELQKYDQLVDMSTIHVQIEEVQKLKENTPVVTFGDQIQKTFKGSVNNLVEVLKALLLTFIACIPFLIVIVPFIAIIVFGVVRFNKYTLNKQIKKQNQQIEKTLLENKKDLEDNRSKE